MKRTTMITSFFLAILLYFSACTSNEKGNAVTINPADEKNQIIAVLDSFNKTAAKADYKGYFELFADDAIFTGTDATERWDKKEFMKWAKPYFDKENTWNFTPLVRHIYLDKTGNTAWFDELLNTQMKICRGSGVLAKQDNDWKIQQYILSITLPNELLDSVIKMKSPKEDSILHTYSGFKNH